MKRVIAYLDGFSLYYSIRGQDWRKYLWLDVDAMARVLAKPQGEIVSVKYFTAMVHPTPKDPDKKNRQGRYLSALRSRDVSVIYGSYKPRTAECHRCHARWITFSEKQTDINIAIEILRDAYDDKFDTMLLVSRDGDLASVLKCVKEQFPQKRIILAVPPGRSSPDLFRFAHAAIHVTESHFKNCQLPDDITTKTGSIVSRPQTWR